MPKVIMGIGLPGSGKTTALRPFAEENEYVYISPDDIREELSGSAIDQSRMTEFWEVVHKRLIAALSEGKTAVVDATFVKPWERKEFIAFARAHGADKVQGVFAAVTKDIALERNSMRERQVPDHAIERMDKHLQQSPPVVEDGFDSVFDISELQELKRVELKTEDKELVKEFKLPKFK